MTNPLQAHCGPPQTVSVGAVSSTTIRCRRRRFRTGIGITAAFDSNTATIADPAFGQVGA